MRSKKGRSLVAGTLVVAISTVGCLDPSLPEQQEENNRMTVNSIPEVGSQGTIRGGEVHLRSLELKTDEFLRFEVLQQGIDVVLTLRDSAGDIVSKVDSPTGNSGPEELVALASEGGVYRLEVRAADSAEEGEYLVRSLETRIATADDRRWVDLDRRYGEARALRKKGRNQEAREKLAALVPAWGALELRRQEADTLKELCLAELGLGETSDALDHCEDAVVWYRLLGHERRLANTLQILGTLRIRRGQLTAAKQLLLEAEPIFRRLHHAKGRAMALVGLAFVASQQGANGEGLGYLGQATSIAADLGDPQLSGVIDNDQGTLLLALQRPREALQRFRSAMDRHRITGDTVELAIALNGLSRATIQLGELETAERQVVDAQREVADADDSRVLLMLQLTHGNLKRLDGDLEGAARILGQALDLARESQLPVVEADIGLSLGYVDLLAGRVGRSLDRFYEAQLLYERSGVSTGEASARARAAEALLHLGRFEVAWQRLGPALDLVQGLRRGVGQRDHRLSYFAFRQDYFELAREILLALRDHTGDESYSRRALEIDEQRRARELLQGIRGARGFAEPTRDANQEAQKALETELRSLALQQADGSTRQRIVEILATLHRLRAEDRSRAPRRDEPEIYFDRLQEMLGSDTVALVFSLGETSSTLWVLGPESLQDHPLPPRRALDRFARAFSEALASPLPEDQALGTDLGFELSQVLLAPLKEALAAHRWVVVSDGALNRIPLAALRDPDGSGRLVVEAHEVVYVPSLSALAALRHRRETLRPSHRVEVFADPVFRADDSRLEGAAASAAKSENPQAPPSTQRALSVLRSAGLIFPRLTASSSEAEILMEDRRSWKARRHVGTSATLSQFLDLDGQELEILHIATHSVLHPEPDLSGLMFSQFGPDGQPVEAFLTSVELSRRQIRSNLTILSACQTVAGKEVQGEGLLSLAWTFLDIGSNRVVASLWKVSDEATAHLMARFYRAFLDQGVAPSAALRTAQAEMARQPGRSAFDWAAFVYLGDWQEVKGIEEK